MSTFLSDAPGWFLGLLALALAYLSILLFKESRLHRGELRSALLVAAFCLLPTVIAALFVYHGDVAGAFNRDLSINRDPVNWWVFKVAPEGGEPWFLNILAALLTFSALYVCMTVLVAMIPALAPRQKRVELLSLHKAMIKWPVIVAGVVLFLNINLWPLLLGMGAVSVVLGFALKEMLENLFTGMALDSEGAFHTGDWIRLGDSETVGKVYEKHWRSTKLLTLQDESITLPNRLLGAEKILTFNRPQPLFACTLNVGTSYNDPPVKVKEILRTLLIREPEIARDPAPRVRTASYADCSIEYEMRFWINDYSRILEITDTILTKIWYAFKFYGIEIPFPIRTTYQIPYDQMHKMQAAHAGEVAGRREFLKSLGYFSRHLEFRDFEFLAHNSFNRHYEPGDPVVHQGEVGDALYIVMTNFCEAVLPNDRRPRIEAGHYFGEMGLLGGQRRTVDVLAGESGADVLMIDRHCMDVLFRAHPDLLEEFKKLRDVRKEELAAEVAAPPQTHVHPLRRACLYTMKFLWPW